MNALSLAVAVRLSGERIRPVRVVAGAAAGAGIAALAGYLRLGRMHAACLWLPAAMIMMALACGTGVLRRPLRSAGLLLSASGLLGGTVLALHGATGSLPIAYALGAMSMTAAALGAMHARRAALDVRKARVWCRMRGQDAAFDAMIDSGNTLSDYLTHLPVIVIAEKRARKAFHLDAVPMRPIFAQTAGGRLMMNVVSPQEIVIEAQDMRHVVRAVMALSPAMEEDMPALVPASLLEEAREKQ